MARGRLMQIDRFGGAVYADFCRGDLFPSRDHIPPGARGFLLRSGRPGISRCVIGRVFPRIVVLVERPVRRPDGEHQVQQLSHAVAQGHIAPRAARTEPSIQGLDGRVVRDGTLGCTEQVAPHQVVSFARHVPAPPSWIAVAIDTGTVLFRKHAKITDQVLRGREAVDRNDLGDQHRGGDLTNARNRGDLQVTRLG